MVEVHNTLLAQSRRGHCLARRPIERWGIYKSTILRQGFKGKGICCVALDRYPFERTVTIKFEQHTMLSLCLVFRHYGLSVYNDVIVPRLDATLPGRTAKLLPDIGL